MHFEGEVLARGKQAQVYFLGNPEKQSNFLNQENVLGEANLEKKMRKKFSQK